MNNNESSLFSNGSLILFGLIVIIVLLVLFPGGKLLTSFEKKPTDQAAVQYLKELVANDPANEELKLQLAHNLVFLGKLSEAEAALQPLLINSNLSNKAQFLTIEIQRKQYFNLVSNAKKKIKKSEIIISIISLYPSLTDVESLDILASWSYGLAEPALAAKIYQKIGEVFDNKKISESKASNNLFWTVLGIQDLFAEDVEKNAEYYAIKELQALLAANLMGDAFNKAKIAVTKFNQSEQILQQAIQIATFSGNPTYSRDWGRLLLTIFGTTEKKIDQQITRELAANDPQNSLQWAELLLTNSSSLPPSFLAYGTSLASSLGNKKIFKQFSSKQLEQNPKDPVLLAQLVQYELALNDLHNALQHANQRTSLEPDNVEARKELIKIAMWNGIPYLSMQQLTQVYHKTGDEDQLKDAIKIGKNLFQHARVAKNYEILSNKRRLSDRELKDLYEVLKQTGYFDSGKRQLKQYIKKWPTHKQARIYLASIEELNGNYSEAYEILKATEQNLGTSWITSRKKIEMLIKAEDYSTAWKNLSLAANSIKPTDSDFWNFYSDISWFLGHEQAAEKAYDHLLTQGEIDQEGINRLLQLSYKGKDNEQHLGLLIKVWNKLNQPNYLLDAIDLSERLKKYEKTNELILIADSHGNLFGNSTRYWTAKARTAIRTKNHLQTKKHLLKALAIDPHLVSTRIALLWHMIEYDSDSSLRKMVRKSIKVTKDHTDLWEAIAASYLRLGEPKSAVPWYAKAVNQKPDDYLLLLGYAETLHNAGEKAKATKIKHYVMTQVRPELVANLSPMKPELAEFKRRYGNVVHQTFGRNITEKWFKWVQLENNKVKQVLFDEYRITWLIAENRMEPARRYLLKSLHKRIAVPTWQNMALAVYDNHIHAIDKLLQKKDTLSPTNQVVGLRTVGREHDALISASNYLDESQKEHELLTLRRQISDLGIRNPNGIALTGKSYNISNLDIRSFSPEFALTHGESSYFLNYKYLNFSSNSTNLLVKPNQRNENNLALRWGYKGIRHKVWLQGKAGLREDRDLYSIKTGVSYKLREGWSANIEAAYNELSEESAAFRLMGARDRITLGLNGGLTKRDYFSIKLHGRNYKTRYGTYLGAGFGADFSAGYRVKFANPAININLHGLISESDLVAQLPAEMQTIVNKNGSIQNVLSDNYKEIGMNFKVYDGEFRPFGFVEKRFHYYFNTGVFFTEPWAGTGVLVEAGIGARLFSHDDLSLMGRYIDSQGGVNTEATQSIELRYSLRFDGIIP